MKLVLIVLGVFLLPEGAFAEVMDKEPSLLQVAGWGIGLGAIMFGLLYKGRLIPALLVLLLAADFFYSLYLEITDRHVGPAILKEAGEIYIINFWAMVVLDIVALVVGGYYYRKSRKILT